MKRVLFLGLVMLLAASSPVSAGWHWLPFPHCTPDTDGKFSASCNATQLTGHTLEANKHTYTFSNTCNASNGTEVSNFTIRTVSEWNSNGTVSQKIYDSAKPGISGTVKATCKYDPWIYDGPEAGNPCTVTDRFFTVPSSGLQGIGQFGSNSMITDATNAAFCTTCRSIPEYQRQEFRNKVNSLITAPTAPVIELPANATSSYHAMGRVPIRIRHNPNYGLSWKFERYSNTFKGWFSAPTPALPLLNAKTVGGVTTGDLNITMTKDATKWRFQVASVFPGAAWSDMREISFYEIKVQPKLPPKLPN